VVGSFEKRFFMKSRFSRFTLIIALLLAPLAVLHAADLGGVKVTLNLSVSGSSWRMP
jgi:hypothetical protein